MTQSIYDATHQDDSITIFRALIADLRFDNLSDTQLCDLSGVAAESAEGLCQGLSYLGESLENGVQIPQESLAQVSAWLKASAHLIPALLALCEQANTRLLYIQNHMPNKAV